MRELFKDTAVSVAVIEDTDTLKADFPLLAAVSRASDGIDRHRPRLITLEYTQVTARDVPATSSCALVALEVGQHTPSHLRNHPTALQGVPAQTAYFVGKGITYDTGGADVKAGGHMAGMHR